VTSGTGLPSGTVDGGNEEESKLVVEAEGVAASKGRSSEGARDGAVAGILF
jgi:hypothetical protein